jgi:small-conductance mechanosensitive channel
MNLNKAYSLLSEKLISWFDALIKLLPNLALAAIVVVLGIFISKLLRRYSLKMIKKFSALETINKLFASFMYILGIGITLFTALDILNLDKAVTTALTGAGILGLALAFAFQDIAANFMSGIFMSFRHPFNVGDLVIINDNLVYEGFGESSINFMIRIWLSSTEQSSYLEARSEAIMMIKKAYDHNNITIPFPIRTLDFGIKGGQTLSEMKLNLLNKKD